MQEIFQIKYRNYPNTGLFMSQYRDNHYIYLEYQDDFKYYENTFIEDILFDGKHSLPWNFFSVSGLDYLLPRILYLIQSEIECLSISLLDFIINMTMTERIVEVINQLEFSELYILNKILEQILYETNEDIVSEIGEHYLFLDLEFLSSKLS